MLKKKGFTLIELVVVMAIIAILSLLIIAAITVARRMSVNTQRTGNVKTLETALEAYASKNGGVYPKGTIAIETLESNLRTTADKGPYLNQEVTVENANYTYSATADGSGYAMAVCEVGNTTAPTVDITAQTAGGCTGSDVAYKTFR